MVTPPANLAVEAMTLRNWECIIQKASNATDDTFFLGILVGAAIVVTGQWAYWLWDHLFR